MAVRANTGQLPDSVSMLGQRRIRLTSNKPAMGCDAGPTLNRYWVGRPTLCVGPYQVHRPSDVATAPAVLSLVPGLDAARYSLPSKN